jgi:hypothetical protein
MECAGAGRARVRLARSLIERATGAAPDAADTEGMLRAQLEQLAKPARSGALP